MRLCFSFNKINREQDLKNLVYKKYCFKRDKHKKSQQQQQQQLYYQKTYIQCFKKEGNIIKTESW